MKKTLLLVLSGALLAFTGCSNNDNDVAVDSPTEGSASANFTVTIENVITPKPIFQSGVFNTPVGKDAPAPLFPMDAYEFDIDAGPVVLPMDGGTRLLWMPMNSISMQVR